MCHLFPPRPRVLINQKEKTSCAIDQIVEPNQMEKPWKSCRFWIILRNCSLLCYQGIRGDTNPPIFPQLRGGTKLWTGTRHVTSLPSRSDQARNLRHVTVTICFSPADSLIVWFHMVPLMWSLSQCTMLPTMAIALWPYPSGLVPQFPAIHILTSYHYSICHWCI